MLEVGEGVEMGSWVGEGGRGWREVLKRSHMHQILSTARQRCTRTLICPHLIMPVHELTAEVEVLEERKESKRKKVWMQR